MSEKSEKHYVGGNAPAPSDILRVAALDAWPQVRVGEDLFAGEAAWRQLVEAADEDLRGELWAALRSYRATS